MKVKDERENLEKLLDESSNKITENVPVPGNIPEELQGQPTMGLNFDELKEQCNG